VLAIAAGFAFKAFRVPLETEQQLAILLRQNGGRLELNAPSLLNEKTNASPISSIRTLPFH
jgi:hypothetical protein